MKDEDQVREERAATPAEPDPKAAADVDGVVRAVAGGGGRVPAADVSGVVRPIGESDNPFRRRLQKESE